MSYIVEVTYQDLVDTISCVLFGGDNLLYYNDILVLSYVNTSDSVAHGDFQYLYSRYPSASYYIIYSYGFQNAADAIPRNTDTSVKTFFIELEGSAPVSQPYSVDCPFTYSLYIERVVFGTIIQYQKTLKILKGLVVVYDKVVDYDYNYNSNYAESVMQTFIDDCIANLKIKTTCCILVCCEPDRYELIT